MNLTFSRGFVEKVSGSLIELHGWECECGGVEPCAVCNGSGQVDHPNGGVNNCPNGYDDGDHFTIRCVGECPRCGGTGRTPGVLGELLRREPITAVGIEVTQVSPVGVVPNEYMRSGTGPERNWAWGFSESTPHGEYMIPRDVWDLMPPTKLAEPRGRYKVFPTEDAARLALSEALFRLHGPKSEVTT